MSVPDTRPDGSKFAPAPGHNPETCQNEYCEHQRAQEPDLDLSERKQGETK
jgi:hypothetical protein